MELARLKKVVARVLSVVAFSLDYAWLFVAAPSGRRVYPISDIRWLDATRVRSLQ